MWCKFVCKQSRIPQRPNEDTWTKGREALYQHIQNPWNFSVYLQKHNTRIKKRKMNTSQMKSHILPQNRKMIQFTNVLPLMASIKHKNKIKCLFSATMVHHQSIVPICNKSLQIYIQITIIIISNTHIRQRSYICELYILQYGGGECPQDHWIFAHDDR